MITRRTGSSVSSIWWRGHTSSWFHAGWRSPRTTTAAMTCAGVGTTLTLVDGCHPVIYAGAGSHAAYFHTTSEYVTGVEPRPLLPLRNAVVWLRKFWVEKLDQGDSASGPKRRSREFFPNRLRGLYGAGGRRRRRPRHNQHVGGRS